MAGLGFPARAELSDGIKAIVHNSIITYQQVGDYTSPFVDELRRQLAVLELCGNVDPGGGLHHGRRNWARFL